ncbi:hypothetical protein OAM56_06390 [Alphaproteobacteria bacterium]|nr:hypothetical protein [Alphaproteobacteria bacterium]
MFKDLSRPLDVHRWSEYPEVNKFVTSIFEEYFRWQNPDLIKKHIKVALLDLYVAWNEHPDMKIGVHMNRNAYKAKSRYNALNISHKIIDVVKRLHEIGFINLTTGFYDPTGRLSRVTRIWSSNELISKFKSAKFTNNHISHFADQEIIILRDENKKDKPYDDDAEIVRMRNILNGYNNLLKQTFIDIPELDKPIIETNDKYIPISSNERLVRRIFNNASWKDGGRFYGGWWQRVPSFFRSKIYLNNEGTIEDDYRSLHPNLLYANKGLDYVKLNRGDAYDIHVPHINDKDDKRKLVKRLMLIAINAKDEVTAFRAVKSELQEEIPYFSFKFDDLKLILKNLKEKHHEIADDFCTGKGLQLMNLDGKITEYIINKFTQNNTPVLCIHDSFVVPRSKDDFLRRTMNEAIINVTSQGLPKIDRKGLGLNEISSVKHLDRDLYLDRVNNLSQTTPNRSKGYMYRKQLFEEYSGKVI